MANKGLSARETRLLSIWERERRTRLTLDDLRGIVGDAAPTVAKRLAQKGALERLERGVYAIRPVRALLSRASPSAAVLVATLLADERYYLGGLWGLTFHRLTEQQYGSRLDVFVQRRKRARILGHAEITFHVLKPAAFQHGIEPARIEDLAVQVSDRERTVLDLLDYPELAGGLLIALDLVKRCLQKLKVKKLVSLAIEGSRLSTCQRLGVLLERAHAPAPTLTSIERHLRESSSRLSMIPSQARRGKLNTRWNVVENDERSRNSAKR